MEELNPRIGYTFCSFPSGKHPETEHKEEAKLIIGNCVA
jgi:hypothetical protein